MCCSGGRDRDRPYGDRSSFGSQRPQLNLQPRFLPPAQLLLHIARWGLVCPLNLVFRTVPLESNVASPIVPVASSKSNPFGEAKPITEEERERRMQAAKV